jgi:CheY-like chemotaxis protein
LRTTRGTLAFEKNVRRAGIHNEIVPLAHGNAALVYLLGQGGTRLPRTGQPHLILLDLNLPDMTGIDILDKVKANPHSQRSPVVTDDQVEIDRCYEGANVYITEPVDYEGFAPAIKSLCQLSKFLPSEFVYS